MLACWRIGAVAQPCTEQLRPADLRARMDSVAPAAVVADERDLDLVAASGFDGPVLAVPDEGLFDADPVPAVGVRPGPPRPDRLHLRHRGRAEADAPRPRLPRPGRACRRSTGTARGPGDLCWCTAASGWSLSARNAFVAAWLRGAAALLHDARFDPDERLELLERERVNVLCMSPTEYRAIAKRAELRRLPDAAPRLRGRRAAQPRGRAGLGGGRRRPGPRRLRPDRDRPPHRHADRPARAARARWAGRCRASAPGSTTGELVVDPATVPTFFLDGPRDRPWRTGDRVREDEDGYLWFEGRTDDVIISAGYRIGPFEVESALVSHPAVAEAAAVAAPDEVRGQVVRAVVVLRDGHAPGERPGRRAPGAREGPRRRPTSTRASWTSRPSCRRRRAARSSAPSCARQPSGSSDAR